MCQHKLIGFHLHHQIVFTFQNNKHMKRLFHLTFSSSVAQVRDGYRLEKPEHCRRELYNIMYYCWDKEPNERPNFTELCDLLEKLILTETEYIELERFPDHSYYNMVSLSGEKL